MMNALTRAVDERFLNHRLRATSLAGISCAVLAIALFAYRFYADRVVSWDLLAVALTNLAVKFGAMAWYSLKD
jgi:hypothetical protein